MYFHRNASRDEYIWSNEKSITIHRDASHPYVPLPVFVGGKWSLVVGRVPQLGTFCHQLHRACYLQAEMPHNATICRILHFSP